MKTKLYFYLRDAAVFWQYWNRSDRDVILGLTISALGPEEDHYISRDYECIGSSEGTFDFDEKVIKDSLLTELERDEKKIRADFVKAIDEIVEKRNQLLCLELKPGDSND